MGNYESIEAAEVRIAELENENRKVVKEIMSNKNAYRQLKTFIESKGIDPNGDLEGQWENTTGKAVGEAETLSRKISALENNYRILKEERDAIAVSSDNNLIKSDLKSRLGDVIGGNDLIDLWIATKKTKVLDGKVYYTDSDLGKDIPIDSFISDFKKNNSDRIRISQGNGSGSNPNSSLRNDSKNSMKKGDFGKLSNAAKNDYLNKGGEIVQD